MATSEPPERQASSSPWSWDQETPLTRCAIATFAGSVGLRSTDLRPSDYELEMLTVFEGKDEDASHPIIHHTQYIQEAREFIANLLHQKTEEELEGLMTRLGELAGGHPGSSITALAVKTGQDLQTSEHAAGCVPALRLLSEMATRNLATSSSPSPSTQ